MFEDFEEHGWDAEQEFHPLYRLHAAASMDYGTYWEAQRDDPDIPGWGLPEVWE